MGRKFAVVIIAMVTIFVLSAQQNFWFSRLRGDTAQEFRAQFFILAHQRKMN